MAANVVGAVWNVRGLEDSQRIVLLRLADVAHPDGSNAFLAVSTVAEDCEIGERTVQRTLHTLVERGFLEVQAPATNRRPTVYRVTIAGLRVVAPVAVSTDEKSSLVRGATVTPLRTVGASQGRHRGAIGVPQMTPDPRSGNQEPEIERVNPPTPLRVEFWNRGCKLRGLLSLSTADEAVIDAWIEAGVTLDDWTAVDAEIAGWNPDHPWAAFKSAMGARVSRGARPAVVRPLRASPRLTGYNAPADPVTGARGGAVVLSFEESNALLESGRRA